MHLLALPRSRFSRTHPHEILRRSSHTQYTTAAEAKVVEEPYDYIIAGGGLAGCVLAERLSAADESKRILILEAGRPDYDNFFIRMPAGILRLFRSVYDWQYESGGEKGCNGRNIFLQRGKVRMFLCTAYKFTCLVYVGHLTVNILSI